MDHRHDCIFNTLVLDHQDHNSSSISIKTLAWIIRSSDLIDLMSN